MPFLKCFQWEGKKSVHFLKTLIFFNEKILNDTEKSLNTFLISVLREEQLDVNMQRSDGRNKSSFIAYILSWPAPTRSVSLGMTGEGKAAGVSSFTWKH